MASVQKCFLNSEGSFTVDYHIVTNYSLPFRRRSVIFQEEQASHCLSYIDLYLLFVPSQVSLQRRISKVCELKIHDLQPETHILAKFEINR